jgi:hypothetical protein
MQTIVGKIGLTKVTAAGNGGNERVLPKKRFTSLVSLLPQGIEKVYSNDCLLSFTSKPAANSGGGFTICGVDINSPFVHASKMTLSPVLPADEPFANEKNIDKAKEWLRKEGWRKRVW